MKNLVWGNVEVNAGLAKPEEETKKDLEKPTTIHKVIMEVEKPIITHEEERAALILLLTGSFTI